MKHLVITGFGTFLGLRDTRLIVKNGDDVKAYPLNRLCTVAIAKKGVTISSDLIEAFSLRGIKLFFLDFRDVAHTVLVGSAQHGVVRARIAQQQYCAADIPHACHIIVLGKVINQRSVINYFNKYHNSTYLTKASEQLLQITNNLSATLSREVLLGMEGSAAHIYFNALSSSQLLPSSFQMRTGRGSQEIINSMLNFGYAILSSYIMSAIINAGLEPYLGFLHTKRPGKPSLVLDLMEEYRAWVVDRVVIKLRNVANQASSLDSNLRKRIITDIQKTMQKKYIYRKNSVRLEYIIQRQVYRLSGHFHGVVKYRPYRFKW